MTEEKTFLLQFQQGDRKAFNAVFEQFYGAIYYFCKRLTSSPEEGEDITLTTFQKLWERRENFETLPNIKAFLFITARNACLTFLKSKYARSVIHKDELDFQAGVEKDAMHKIIQAEIMREIDEEVQQLPRLARQVFELRFYQNMNIQEVAAQLNISENSVSVHTNTAINTLRTRFLRKKWLHLILLIMSLVSVFKKNI
jgi:RNA polymerase sigma-70 factor (ECF subfamily)